MARSVPDDASRFLVVRLGAIGDCLRVVPALRRLRRERPGAHIAWAIENWAHGAVSACSAVDRFHILDRGRLGAGPRGALTELARFKAELAAEGYQVALDFHARLKSGVVTRMSGAPCRIGYGRADATEGNHLFTNIHVRLEDPSESRVLRYLELLGPLGIPTEYGPELAGLDLEAEDLEMAQGWHQKAGRPRLAVYPGTSARRAGERWPSNKWIALLAQLARDGVRPVVFWGPSDQHSAAEIADGAGVELAPRSTLGEMMAMLGLFDCFVGADTAAMHMSWLQGVPAVFFSGPRLARTDAPLAPVPSRALCASRYLVEGRRYGRQPKETVTEVSVEEALTAVRDLLGHPGGDQRE